MKDYYDILEINETASTEVIKAAYRALVKKYHPDNYELENEDITERMAELNEAYAVLSDEKKRKDYDIQYTSINSNLHYWTIEGYYFFCFYEVIIYIIIYFFKFSFFIIFTCI